MYIHSAVCLPWLKLYILDTSEIVCESVPNQHTWQLQPIIFLISTLDCGGIPVVLLCYTK